MLDRMGLTCDRHKVRERGRKMTWGEIVKEIEARLNRRISPHEAEKVWELTRRFLLTPNEIAAMFAELEGA